MSKKIFIKTFGSQMNEYDSNRIFDIVKKIGYKKTEDHKNAQILARGTQVVERAHPHKKLL